MAFDLASFDRCFQVGNTTLPTFWTYRSDTDTVATIETANYFDLVGDLVTSNKYLAIGDYILIKGSASSDVAFVTATTPHVLVSPLALTIAANSIVNSQINSAAAIAVSKLAAGTSAQVLLNSATPTPTWTTLSGDVTVGATGVTAIGTGKVLSAMIADTILKYTTVAITAAQFNGMYTTPKQLVAAGGANTLLILDKVQLLMTYGAAAFAAGGVAAVQYDSTANGAGVIASTTLAAATFQATASTAWNFNAGVVAETFSTCVNKGLYLSNVTGVFTTGDSTFVAHIWYKVIPTV